MNDDVFNLICFVTILILLIIVSIMRYIYNKKGEKKVVKFLDDFQEELLQYIYKKSTLIDCRVYENAESFAKHMLVEIENLSWDFIEKKVEAVSGNSSLSFLLKKYINRDFINHYIRKMIEDNSIVMHLMNIYASSNMSEEVIAELENVDQLLDNSFTLGEGYENEEYNEEEIDPKTYEYEPAQEYVPTEEELAQLNPQLDIDEEDIQLDDDSVEIIEEYIEEKVNKAGRTMYYLVDENGKKKQISSEKAHDSGLEIRKV